MNQLVIGAAIPFLLAAVVYALRGLRAGKGTLILVPLLMAIGSIWAVVPDLPRLLGNGRLYMQLLNDPRTNIFFFHYTIDRIETDSPWWFPIFVIIGGAMLWAAWRELSRAERYAFPKQTRKVAK